ncbi:MAG: MBL fold metallo-hydrolase [Dehalococcoidia bacterium]
MEKPFAAAQDIEVLPAYFPIPGFGIIPVNSFIIEAKEPVLVDTGLVLESDQFMETLRSVIDPPDLKWIWLTHTDQDHIGSLHRILEEVPQVKVITTFLGVGKMSLFAPLPLDRVHLLNPDQTINIGDRTLTAVKPPAFDAPETTGLYDDKSGVFFSSDCFGALLSSPAQNTSDIAPKDLIEGQTLWATIDAPWLHSVDQRVFGTALNSIREMSPKMVLSNHLPPASGMTDQLLKTLSGAREANPFVGPDQAALEAMLVQMTGGN